MTVQVKTRVLAGNRIEVSAAGLREGQDVKVTIEPVEASPQPQGPPAARSSKPGILDFIDALPPSRMTPEEWSEFEREFRQERDSWDR